MFKVIVDVSQKYDLELFKKNRGQMKFLTNGQPAFFVSLYFKGDAVLVISNIGSGDVLFMSIHDYEKMPFNELSEISDEIRRTLKRDLKIDLIQE